MNKSEFASLADLVTEKGTSYSSLVSEIHDRVLNEYRKLHPDAPKTVDVVVDAKSGEVRLMRDKQDVTPESFTPIAEKIAREVLIERLHNLPEKPKYSPPKGTRPDYELLNNLNKRNNKIPSGTGKFLMNLIFWGYNILFFFIIFIFLSNLDFSGILTGDFFDQLKDTGLFRAFFLIIAGAIPFITTFVAVKYKERIKTEQLASLFFLFEVPLVFVSIVFANVFSSPGPVMWFLFMTFVFAIPIFLAHLLKIKIESKRYNVIAFSLREMLFLTSFYITLLFTFIAPLILGTMAKVIYEFISYDIVEAIIEPYRHINPFSIIIAFILGGLGILIVLGFTAAPYLLTFHLGKIFAQAKESLAKQVSSLHVQRYAYIFGFLWFLLVFGTSYQPGTDRYIDRLEALTKSETFEEKEEIAKDLLDKEGQIKKAFDNLSNVRRKYIMAKSDDILKNAYEEIFGFEGMAAELIHNSFTTLAYPFVYQGSLDRNYEARSAFNYLFAKTLSTPSRTTSAKNVELFSRTIDVNTDHDGFIATVSIDEVYTNSTFTDQEIIYEFYLPEDAVVTELLLGPDLEFPGAIAPKGAAQETYERQIVRRRDPALLEQTGPAQYRLRVYPIPSRNNRIVLNGKNQRVKFSYTTTLQPNGYPLPVYTRKENIKTKDTFDNVMIDGVTALVDNNFVKNNSTESIASKLCSLTSDFALNNKFASLSAYLIPNSKVTINDNSVECTGNGDLNIAPVAKDLKFAVIVDVSYKNKDNKVLEEVKKVLNNDQLLDSNEVYIQKINDLISKPVRLEVGKFDEQLDLNFFGIGNWITTYNKLDDNYDFVILFTNSEQPSSNTSTKVRVDIPLYVVHNKDIPAYTTNITTNILQSGGYSFNNFGKALNKAILDNTEVIVGNKKIMASGEYFSYYTDSSAPNIYFLPNWDKTSTTNENDPASYLFAGKFLRGMYGTTKADLNSQVSFLDLFNNFSKNNSVVGPHSSLIALVNETQLRTLENLSKNLDRYRDEATPQAGGDLRGGQAFNLSPPAFTESRTLSPGGVDLFGSLGMEKSVGDSGSGIGIPIVLRGPSDIMATNGGGGGGFLSFSGVSIFIVANIVLIGGGMIGFLIFRLRKKRKK